MRNMTHAEIIKSLRDKHGWSQQEMGRQLGVDQATVSRIERGAAPAKPVALLIERMAADTRKGKKAA